MRPAGWLLALLALPALRGEARALPAPRRALLQEETSTEASPVSVGGNMAVKTMEAGSSQMGVGNPVLLHSGTPSVGPTSPTAPPGAAAAVKPQPPGMHPWPAGPGATDNNPWNAWGGHLAATTPPGWVQPTPDEVGGVTLGANGATMWYPGAVWVPSMADNTGAFDVVTATEAAEAAGPSPPAPVMVTVLPAPPRAAAPEASIAGLRVPVTALSTPAVASKLSNFFTGRRLAEEQPEA